MSETLDHALARVEAAIGRLDEAARADEIEPGSLLDTWATAVKALCEANLEVERQRAAELRGYLAVARNTADALLEAGRQATEEARIELRKIDRFIELAEARVAEREAESVSRIAAGLAERVQGVMVIRAKAYNRERAAGLAGVGAVVFAVVLLAGVVLDRVALADPRPGQVWRACLAHTSKDAASGKTYCALEVPPDSGGLGTR